MIPSLDIAFTGMQASLEQMECVGERMAHLISGNDPARDMVKLITQERAFEANAAVARTADEVVGSIIDLIV